MKYDIEQLLEAGEVIQIYPEGYSMYPMFVPGRDAAVIKKADVKKIRRADVVLYRRKGSILVLHRVVKRKGGQFYMAGDNQTEVEGPVEADQIRGILTAFVRNGRRISVKNPLCKYVPYTSGLFTDAIHALKFSNAASGFEHFSISFSKNCFSGSPRLENDATDILCGESITATWFGSAILCKVSSGILVSTMTFLSPESRISSATSNSATSFETPLYQS